MNRYSWYIVIYRWNSRSRKNRRFKSSILTRNINRWSRNASSMRTRFKTGSRRSMVWIDRIRSCSRKFRVSRVSCSSRNCRIRS